jgi:hypothetical protein
MARLKDVFVPGTLENIVKRCCIKQTNASKKKGINLFLLHSKNNPVQKIEPSLTSFAYSHILRFLHCAIRTFANSVPVSK